METASNHRRSSSANDAITPTSHRRIPFVHRLSSFRRNHHNRAASSSSQLSSSLSDTTSTKPKDDILSSDLILKVAIVRGRSLAREDEVNTKKRIKHLVCVTFTSLFFTLVAQFFFFWYFYRQIFRIHMSMCAVEASDTEQTH